MDHLHELPHNFSMRDLHDFCRRHSIESLAVRFVGGAVQWRSTNGRRAGMIEFPPPQRLRELAAEVTGGLEGHTYRSRRGEPDFLNAVVKALREVYSTNVTEASLLACSGVTGGIVAGLRVARKHHPKLVVGLTSVYYTYHARHVDVATSGQSKPVFVKLDSENATFDFDWASLQKHLDAGMGALIVCNPGNPSGRVYPKEVLNKLVEMTAKHNCYLIFDEIYADLVWTELTGKKFYSPVQDALHKHVLCCRGFSKNVACQSWRVGYVISHPDTIAEAMNEHDPIYISVPILQHAVARFLNEHLDEYKAHIQAANAMMMRNLAMLSRALEQSMGWRYCAPEGSMYAMFRHSEATDMDAVVAGVKKGVGVAGGSMFFEGNPACSGFVRIHVGLDEERVKRICQSLTEATPQP